MDIWNCADLIKFPVLSEKLFWCRTDTGEGMASLGVYLGASKTVGTCQA